MSDNQLNTPKNRNSHRKSKISHIAPSKVKIPKIIMQTWKNTEVPDHWKPSKTAIEKLMPDWEYVLMTDDDNKNFCEQHFPDFLPYYEQFEYGIMRADAIRCMWLYVKGGLYLDLDIELVKPVDELFYEDHEIYVVKSGNFSNYYTNAFMASKPGAQFWLRCIDAMKAPYSLWQIGKHLKVMGTTGPLMVSKVIYEAFPDKYEMPAKLLTSCSVCDPKPCNIQDGYARTLEGSSWVEADTRFYIFCTCNWKAICLVIIILIIIVIIWYRHYRVNRHR